MFLAEMKDVDTVSICTRDHQHAQTLSASLYNLKTSNVLCDVTLLCGKIQINAHKVVLAACSEYFQAMFTSGMCETRNDEIIMKNIDTDALSMLVSYAYNGLLILNELNVQTLLETADLLQFQSAKLLCCDFIKEKLNIENCLDIFLFADTYRCEDILTLSQSLFNKHWKKIIQYESFLRTDYNVVVKLISSDMLQISKESDVLVILFRWIDGNFHERKDTLLSLLEHVRWSYIRPAELKRIINNYSHIVDHNEIMNTIESFVSPSLFSLTSFRMRKSYESWMYILGGEQSFLMELKSCEFFNHRTALWDYGFSLHGPRTSFAAIAHGEKLYMIGGMRFGEKLKIVECYNRQLGKWKRLSSLKKCQGDVEASIVNDVLYVAGGSSEGEPACRYVEEYDESNNQWHSVANMKSRRRRFGLCEYKSKLYAIGGFQDSLGELRTCEVYNPDANTWENIAPMKTNRCDLGIAVLSGFIYVAGGVNSYTGSICTVEKYNPETDTWCSCEPLQQARGGHAMVSYFGRIIAIGGMNSYMQTCKDAEWYNEVSDEWTPLPSTNMPRFGGVAVVLPFCRRPRTYNEEEA